MPFFKKIFSSFRGARSSYSLVTVIFLPKKKAYFLKRFYASKKNFIEVRIVLKLGNTFCVCKISFCVYVTM